MGGLPAGACDLQWPGHSYLLWVQTSIVGTDASDPKQGGHSPELPLVNPYSRFGSRCDKTRSFQRMVRPRVARLRTWLALRREGLAGDVLHDRDGALAHKRDGLGRGARCASTGSEWLSRGPRRERESEAATVRV